MRSFSKLLFSLIITSLFLSCSNNAATFTIGGTATGIDGNITLQNNAKDDFIITNDVDFIFDTALEAGQSYNVKVSDHPAGQTCTVTNGEGTVTEKVTNITVACALTSATLTVNVTHLNGTVVLQNNAGDDLTVDENGEHTFETEVLVGEDYDVSVLTQPTNQTCQITDASGTIGEEGAKVSIACGKVIFISDTIFLGSFGTLTIQPTGDHQCDIDAANPDSTKMYKVLQTDGVNRTACTTANCSGGISENSDWVLTPNTTYVRPDDTIIFTSNSAGIFDFGGGSFLNFYTGGAQMLLWTGLSSDWTVAMDNCINWSSAMNADNGQMGLSDATDANAIADSTQPCDTALVHLICVEQ